MLEPETPLKLWSMLESVDNIQVNSRDKNMQAARISLLTRSLRAGPSTRGRPLAEIEGRGWTYQLL